MVRTMVALSMANALFVFEVVVPTVWQRTLPQTPWSCPSLVVVVGRCCFSRKQYTFKAVFANVALRAAWTTPTTWMRLMAGVTALFVLCGFMCVLLPLTNPPTRRKSGCSRKLLVTPCFSSLGSSFEAKTTVAISSHLAHDSDTTNMRAILYPEEAHDIHMICFDAVVVLVSLPVGVVWCIVAYLVCGGHKLPNVSTCGCHVPPPRTALVSVEICSRWTLFDRCRRSAFRSTRWSKIENSIPMTATSMCHALIYGRIGAIVASLVPCEQDDLTSSTTSGYLWKALRRRLLDA
ncbi:hypothetical protein H310_02173 [Aphanomyces invadans]|uniref:Membrane-associated protein n=1 Tax=Aphanomyces invadans TaxID=157072 RepID=A0A024UMN5_9STRA|nr:hypothetical protein H310_02173 [Aphanomyces invadans]ETW07726.1 hypothetical protein H310_02173 [Aphanomyces invadans]|eukprot:XP_008863819.1 hypothetical protein H310_02173 [Aphanomyces invadans]